MSFASWAVSSSPVRSATRAARFPCATLRAVAAIAAYGGFFIPKSYGTSISMTGGPEFALYTFIVFYLLCIGVTWWYYARRNAEMPC